jgi:chromosome segregation ATPase
MMLQELLARRLETVAQVSLATSALQKLLQARASAEMDAMRCEIAMGREPTDEVARDLLEARERFDDAELRIERCEAEIAALEATLAEIDREIAEDARQQAPRGRNET